MTALTPEYLDRRIDGIIKYLSKSQGADGEFVAQRHFHGVVESYATPTVHAGWYGFGKCPFMTATIVYHLKQLEDPRVVEVRRRACAFLAGTVERGVVRYVPARYQDIWFPTDVDDTCLVARVLRDEGFPVVIDDRALLGNVGRRGHMYTWLLPRWRLLPHFSSWRWLAADWLQYAKRLLRQDIANGRRLLKEYRSASEPAVLANVLLYFGNDLRVRHFVQPLLDHALAVSPALEYYDSVGGLHFHLARLFDAGERAMISAEPRATAHIRELQQNDGTVRNEFDTAMAALTLMYFERWDDELLERAIGRLAHGSMHAGGWLPFPYVNPVNRAFSDGSADLTAALSLDALVRYRKRLTSR